MKKTVIVAALAAMLVFAFSGAAFAAGINHSGQMRLGAAAAAPATPANGPFAGTPVAGAGTNIYEDWQPLLGTNASNGNSPHGNYTTTTVKCVVCHAVHYAAPGGAPVGSGQTADTLLRVRADSACIFCHATDGMAVNGTPVYDGLGGAITAPGATGGATNTGHIIGTNCSYCHTNVHGAYADNSVAALQGYLLKNMTATNVQNTGATTNNMLDAITAIDHNAVNQGFAPGAALGYQIGDFATVDNFGGEGMQAVGVFCAECHLGAYATNAAGAATNVYGSGSAAYSGHRVGFNVTNTSNWNADGSKSSSMLAAGQAIAFAPATSCTSCHDSKDHYLQTAFPHSWGGTKMWLTAAADAGAPSENLPYGTAVNSAYNAGKPQLSDGVCLKCHVASGGSAGVGITF